ncbi:MAG: hypothetical protein HY692_07045, partial [Cyanobacteria bacterium NC_groundwater_1444_Ag_S-0.65um_54_12]|nr:hypothetical protein [Cyanobacteria bacterium NC_groundwater_1444_Ag_S-0.65um_54_12]
VNYDLTALQQAWSNAYLDNPFPLQSCQAAIAQGYLEEKNGLLTLTFAGESYVQNGLQDRSY